VINGLYSSASGMDAELMRQDVVANNLANVNTVGYKKDEAVFTDFPNTVLHRIDDRMKGQGQSFLGPQKDPVLGVLGHGVQTFAIVSKFSDGPPVQTGNPLDLALTGNALFSIERSDGSPAFVRAGNFTRNDAGQIVTQNGDVVLGDNGEPIHIDTNDSSAALVIDHSGRVMVGDEERGRLALATYDSAKMVKEGEGVYVRHADDIEAVSDDAPPKATVTQGFLEQSNAQVVEEMVNMITVTRSYEANQKSIAVQDASLDKVINEVGKV
jgi:flagellar basal-body rod protein FlgF